MLAGRMGTTQGRPSSHRRLVMGDHHARLQSARVDELQLEARVAVLEQWYPLAEEDRVHADPILVDQAVPLQRGGEVGAAEDVDVLAGLLLQLLDRRDRIALDQRRVAPI